MDISAVDYKNNGNQSTENHFKSKLEPFLRENSIEEEKNSNLENNYTDTLDLDCLIDQPSFNGNFF